MLQRDQKLRIRFGLKAKVQLVVATSLVVLATIVFAFAYKIVFSSYERLEAEDVRLTVERVANADDQFLQHLYERQFDWASWDDAYQFVQDGNAAFKKINLGPAELASNKLDLIAFVQTSGRIISAEATTRFKKPGSPDVAEIIKQLNLNDPNEVRKLSQTKGLTLLHQGHPLNITVRPISRTNGTGNEVGWLVWGQYIAKEDLRKMANTLKIGIVDLPFANVRNDPEFIHSTWMNSESTKFQAISDSPNTTFAFYTIRDYRGHPIWVQKIYVPRNIHAQGVLTFKTLFKWLIMGSALFCVVLFLAIDLIFLRRIKALASTFSVSHEPKEIRVTGNDELTDLAIAFRSTLEALNAGKAELRALNEGLEETVERRTTDLVRATAEAERANAAKSEFLSHMSHELRTPLNAVIGFAQLIQMREIDSKTADSAEAILKAGKHLLNLVNEILDLSKIESGKLSISVEPVQVMAPLQQAIGLVKSLAEERNINVIVEQPPLPKAGVQADQQRLMQVLLNLLSNAVKYNRPNGTVRIRCRDADGGKYRIEIEDTGFGLDPNHLDKLFAPFERFGKPGIEGTGLGLALSRNLARVMGGELSLLRTDLNGSLFVIELPSAVLPSLSLTEEVSQVISAFPEEEETTLMVYIEDNLANLELMTSLIGELEGFDLRAATDAHQGLRMVQDLLPDVVLLDVNLGSIEGVEVVKELKNNPLTKAIPIIVLSADATEGQIRRLLEAGAKTYLTKPLNISLLLAELSIIQPRSRKAA